MGSNCLALRYPDTGGKLLEELEIEGLSLQLQSTCLPICVTEDVTESRATTNVPDDT